MRKFHRLPLWAPADEGTPPAAPPPATPPAAGDPPPPATPPAATPPAATPPAGRWWEGDGFADPARQFLTAKGLTLDDPMQAMPKLIDIAANAERRIGRGVDSILDKPAKDQALPDWMRANAATLGLPDKEDGYAVQPPETWPKDLPWNADLEARARKIAFEKGVLPEAHQAYVGLFAEAMAQWDTEATTARTRANEQMMADLTRDWGDQTQARITLAKQAAQTFAEKAGMSAEGLRAMAELLSEKTGDATTIRFMAALGEAMGEDAAIGIGKGGSLTMTPAEARQQLSEFTRQGSEWYNAVAAGDQSAISRLRPRYEELSRRAAG